MLQFMGDLVPLVSDKLHPCLSPFSFPRFPSPPFPLPLLFLPRQTDEVFIRCGLFTVMCIKGLHLSLHPYPRKLRL